jgi:hypothetical protein
VRQDRGEPKQCQSLHEAELSFGRTQSSVVTGILTGYNNLSRHHPMGLSDRPLCRRRGAQDDTSAHILCECEAFASLRYVYLGCFSFESEDIKSIILGVIWSFSKVTGPPLTEMGHKGTVNYGVGASSLQSPRAHLQINQSIIRMRHV